MDVAPRMAARRGAAIGLPPVVHAHPPVAGQDADGSGRLRAPLGLDGRVGQPRRARHMRPRQLARPPYAGLVDVPHRRASPRRLDPPLDGPQRRGPLPHPARERAHGDPRAREVGEELADPGIRDGSLLHRVDRQRPQPRAVLRPAGRLGREDPHAHPRTPRAAHVQRPVLAHQQAQRGQLADLAPLVARHGCRLAQGRLARRADGGPMLDQLVGRRHQMQRLAAVAQRPARLLAAPLALAAGALATQRIARWRFVAGVAVFGRVGQSHLQVLDLGHELLDLGPQRGIARPQCGIRSFQLADAFAWRHAPMLHLQHKSVCTDPRPDTSATSPHGIWGGPAGNRTRMLGLEDRSSVH